MVVATWRELLSGQALSDSVAVERDRLCGIVVSMERRRQGRRLAVWPSVGGC